MPVAAVQVLRLARRQVAPRRQRGERPDPARVTYKQLLKVFFDNHDPTTPDRQGPDVGSNYRSAIFASSLFGDLITMVLLPVPVLGMVLLYFDVRRKRDSFTPDNLRADLDALKGA